MAFFSRRRDRVVPTFVVESLAGYGAAVLANRSGQAMSPSFGWEYVGAVVSPMHGTDRDRVIQELYDAALASTEVSLATVGACNLLSESSTAERDGRFLELLDASLAYMHQMGYSSGHLTRYEADRWIEVHGDLRSSFDNIVEVAVPGPSEAPPVAVIDVGESRLIALTAPLPEGNAFYAEHQSLDRYLVWSERRTSSDDPTRKRCDESYLGTFTSLLELMRAVGQMFGTQPYWADGDLEPYFPAKREHPPS